MGFNEGFNSSSESTRSTSLVLKNISKIFALKNGDFAALKSVNLEFEKGSFYTLLGPSGCGKTTLLRLIAGFEAPTSGEILYNGQDITASPPEKRGFPLVFQSYALFPHMNVFENIAYGLRIQKVADLQLKKRVKAMIDLLELGPNEHKYPHQMSGGQQQRVALARALVLEPEIILFDEPLSNLDARLRVLMRDEIRSIQQKTGVTAIYVTHDQDEALAISDQIVVFNQGKVEQVGSPSQIYQKPTTEFVANFIGSANVFDVKTLNGIEFQLLDSKYEFVERAQSAAMNMRSEGRAMVRPEHIRLSREDNSLGESPVNDESRTDRDKVVVQKAVVERSVFMGSKVHYHVKVGDETVSVVEPFTEPSEIYRSGEIVFAMIDPAKIHFL